MYSYHWNAREDRRWRFDCCAMKAKRLYRCRWTGYINNWDGRMDYTIPNNYVISRIWSHYHSGRRDRRWRLVICSVRTRTRPKYCMLGRRRLRHGYTWRRKCNTCRCWMGRISCTRRRCPRRPNRTFSGWLNNWDRPLNFRCRANYYLNRLASYHHNGTEDRRWRAGCQWFRWGLKSCRRSGWVNNWRQTINYVCPSGKVLAGMYSYHWNAREDRRWRFDCCAMKAKRLYRCRWTGYINNWDGRMDYTIPNHYVISRIWSHYHSGRRDRRWRLIICMTR